MVAKYIRYPFASAGDRTPIPETVQAGGEVSWPQGYGPDYQLDPTSDPDALRIERLFFNQALFDVSSGLQQYQQFGFPDWITAADNGGVAFAYALNSFVRHDDAVWQAIDAGATAEPGTDPTEWVEFTTGVSTALQKAANLSDLTNVGTARANLGLGSAATFSASTFATAIAPVITGGLTLSGRLVQDVIAVPALAIDFGATSSDWPTKSIAVNSVFTFTNIPAAGVAAVKILTLTLTGGAVPTFPASVVWVDGTVPTWANGVWDVGLKTIDGGVVVHGKASKFAS